jgi:hypothetical protein
MPNLLLRATMRLRLSWTQWSLTRTRKRQQRETHRLHLLQVRTDSQLLLLKELSQREHQLRHRLAETTASQQYRTQQQIPGLVHLPPGSQPSPELLKELSQQLSRHLLPSDSLPTGPDQ